MALTNTGTKEDLDVIMLLAQIAKGLAALGNEKDIDALINRVSQLSEKEMSQAREARAEINKYQGLIAENRALLAELDAEQKDIDKRAAEAQEAARTLDARNAALNTREKKLADIDSAQAVLADELRNRELKVNAEREKLLSDRAKLEDDIKRVAKLEDSLKDKEEKLKNLLNG